MQLKFKYNWQDFFSATTLHFCKKSFARKRDKIIYAVIILYATWCWYSFGFSIIWPLLMLFPIWAYCLIILFVMAKVKQEKKFLQGETEIILNDDVLHIKRDQVESKMLWNVFNSMFENEKVFILYYGDSLFLTIPKRALAGPKEQSQFKVFIRAKTKIQ